MGTREEEVLDDLLGPEQPAANGPQVVGLVEQSADQAAREEDAVVVSKHGAVRSADATLERYDLIPKCVLKRLAQVFAYGAWKRGERNWEQGLSGSDTLNRVYRHLIEWEEGTEELPTSATCNDDHLAHALWNICALMHHEEKHPDLLMDIPGRRELRQRLEEGSHNE